MNEKLTGNDAPEMRVLIDNLKKQAELLYTQANRFHNCTTTLLSPEPEDACDEIAKEPSVNNYTDELRLLIKKLDDVIRYNDYTIGRFNQIL